MSRRSDEDDLARALEEQQTEDGQVNPLLARLKRNMKKNDLGGVIRTAHTSSSLFQQQCTTHPRSPQDFNLDWGYEGYESDDYYIKIIAGSESIKISLPTGKADQSPASIDGEDISYDDSGAIIAIGGLSITYEDYEGVTVVSSIGNASITYKSQYTGYHTYVVVDDIYNTATGRSAINDGESLNADASACSLM